MTLHEAMMLLKKQLTPVYDEAEAGNIAVIAMQEIMGVQRSELMQHKNTVLNNEQLQLLSKYETELSTAKPLQYVLGKAWFYDLEFAVNESVLIPRPETEELVHLVIKDAKKAKRTNLFILDVGTGSGCIPISVKHYLPDANVFAIDVSADALSVAKSNADKNKTDIHFIEMNFLNTDERNILPQFDIIISNPPYVKRTEAASMHENVLNHEPHLALFVPDDNALLFYEAIASFAKTHLKQDGKIYVEINEALGKQTEAVFQNTGFTNTTIIQDMQGKDRIVTAAF